MIQINNIAKIGVISDTHIPSRTKTLPPEIFTLFKDVNSIIHCGDIVSEDVLIELNSIAPVIGVKGNMDPGEITLPKEQVILINNTITACVAHGSGSPFGLRDKLYKVFTKNKPHIILYGHSHIPENSKYNDILFFNPGSATCGNEYNSVGIINISNVDVKGEIIQI